MSIQRSPGGVFQRIKRTFTRRKSMSRMRDVPNPFMAFFYAPRTYLSKRNMYVVMYTWNATNEGYSKMVFYTERGIVRPYESEEPISLHDFYKELSRYRKEYMYMYEKYTPEELFYMLRGKLKKEYTLEWFKDMYTTIKKST